MPSEPTPLATARFVLAHDAATARLGAALAQAIEAHRQAIGRHGLAIGLSGELGSGKTALVRALLRRLGVHGAVRSPTFSLLELYAVSSLNFYHFDLYRFSKPDEFVASGFREYFAPGAVCAVEWPERAGPNSFDADLRVLLQVHEPGRIAQIDALSQTGRDCLREVEREWQTNHDAKPDAAC